MICRRQLCTRLQFIVEEATDTVTLTQLGHISWSDWWWWTVIRVQQFFRLTPDRFLVACSLSQLLCVESAPRSLDLDQDVGYGTRCSVDHVIALGSSPLPVAFQLSTCPLTA